MADWTLNREELAWAAGFFDGEGHVRGKRENRCAELQVAQKDPECLQRLQRACGGFGKTGGPYHTKNPVYFWYLTKTSQVDEVLTALWPWLSGPKKLQAGNGGFVLGAIRAPRPGVRVKPEHQRKNAACHPDRQQVAKGLCHTCYHRQWEAQKRAS